MHGKPTINRSNFPEKKNMVHGDIKPKTCYYDWIIILLTEIIIISTEMADVNLHTYLVYTSGQQSEKSFEIVDEVEDNGFFCVRIFW